jgi:hypothetical protein
MSFIRISSVSHTLLKGINKLLSVMFIFIDLIWLTFGTEYLHVMALSKSDFCENWDREGYTMLVDVNGIIFIHVP